MVRFARCILLAVSAALAASGPAAAQSGAAPADVVKTIYDRVTVFCNGEDVAPPYVDKFMRAAFEKPVADRYLARLHKSQLDFDIFIDGQDCKLTGLGIEPLETAAGTAVVRVRLDNFGQPRTIDFQFRNAAGGWMISDMVYRHRKFTLRSFLKLNP
jgi:hypothetical protein